MGEFMVKGQISVASFFNPIGWTRD